MCCEWRGAQGRRGRRQHVFERRSQKSDREKLFLMNSNFQIFSVRNFNAISCVRHLSTWFVSLWGGKKGGRRDAEGNEWWHNKKTVALRSEQSVTLSNEDNETLEAEKKVFSMSTRCQVKENLTHIDCARSETRECGSLRFFVPIKQLCLILIATIHFTYSRLSCVCN